MTDDVFGLSFATVTRTRRSRWCVRAALGSASVRAAAQSLESTSTLSTPCRTYHSRRADFDSSVRGIFCLSRRSSPPTSCTVGPRMGQSSARHQPVQESPASSDMSTADQQAGGAEAPGVDTADVASRIRAALWSLFVSDALAMPTHWYADAFGACRQPPSTSVLPCPLPSSTVLPFLLPPHTTTSSTSTTTTSPL